MDDKVTVLISKDGNIWKTITVPIENGVARIGEYFWREEDFTPHRTVTLNLDEFLPSGFDEKDTAFLKLIQSLRQKVNQNE